MKTIEEILIERGVYKKGIGLKNLLQAWEIVEAMEEYASMKQDELIERINKYFQQLRFDKNFHLGLGDIRLTIDMQEDLIKSLK